MYKKIFFHLIICEITSYIPFEKRREKKIKNFSLLLLQIMFIYNKINRTHHVYIKFKNKKL